MSVEVEDLLKAVVARARDAQDDLNKAVECMAENVGDEDAARTCILKVLEAPEEEFREKT